MLRSQERNSVAVLYQGPQSGIAPAVERQTVLCQGKLCKAGKSGLAKSSSSFQVKSGSESVGCGVRVDRERRGANVSF